MRKTLQVSENVATANQWATGGWGASHMHSTTQLATFQSPPTFARNDFPASEAVTKANGVAISDPNILEHYSARPSPEPFLRLLKQHGGCLQCERLFATTDRLPQ